MRLKASDTGGIWPYEKRLTPRYFIPPQSGPMGVLKRLLSKIKMGIVLLEAKGNRYEDLAPLMNQVNTALRTIEKGQVISVRA